MESDIFRGHGVEIYLKNKEDFLMIKETLTRIGVASKKTKTLNQSVHILHKQGRYVLIHFKELFAMDGKKTDFTDEDKGRRNTISQLLAEWGLVMIKNPEQCKIPVVPLAHVKIIPHNEKNDWQLVAKYQVGKKF